MCLRLDPSLSRHVDERLIFEDISRSSARCPSELLSAVEELDFRRVDRPLSFLEEWWRSSQSLATPRERLEAVAYSSLLDRFARGVGARAIPSGDRGSTRSSSRPHAAHAGRARAVWSPCWGRWPRFIATAARCSPRSGSEWSRGGERAYPHPSAHPGALAARRRALRRLHRGPREAPIAVEALDVLGKMTPAAAEPLRQKSLESGAERRAFERAVAELESNVALLEELLNDEQCPPFAYVTWVWRVSEGLVDYSRARISPPPPGARDTSSALAAVVAWLRAARERGRAPARSGRERDRVRPAPPALLEDSAPLTARDSGRGRDPCRRSSGAGALHRRANSDAQRGRERRGQSDRGRRGAAEASNRSSRLRAGFELLAHAPPFRELGRRSRAAPAPGQPLFVEPSATRSLAR